MDVDLGQITVALIVVAVVFSLSYKLTCIGGPSKHRFKSYLACLCITYALVVAIAEINGARGEAKGWVFEWGSPGVTWRTPARSREERNDLTREFFYVSIVPAFLGVYCGRRSGRRGKMGGAGARKDAHDLYPVINAQITAPQPADAIIPAHTYEPPEPGRR